jgi:hypothetical protein
MRATRSNQRLGQRRTVALVPCNSPNSSQRPKAQIEGAARIAQQWTEGVEHELPPVLRAPVYERARARERNHAGGAADERHGSVLLANRVELGSTVHCVGQDASRHPPAPRYVELADRPEVEASERAGNGPS